MDIFFNNIQYPSQKSKEYTLLANAGLTATMTTYKAITGVFTFKNIKKY